MWQIVAHPTISSIHSLRQPSQLVTWFLLRHLTWWRFYLLSPSLSFPPLFSHFQSLSFTLHRNTTQHCTKHHHLTFHSPLNILQKKIIQCNYLQSWFLPQVENPSINVIDWQIGTPAAIKGEFVFIGNNTDNSTDPHLTSISPIYFCFCLCHFLRTLHNFNYTVALSSAYLHSHETISTSCFHAFQLANSLCHLFHCESDI